MGLIVEEVVKKTLSEIALKNGKPALSLYGDFTHLHMNPSGKFIIGGPQGDAVLREGSNQGRQVSSLRVQADGQVCREEWIVPEGIGAAFLRHRSCEASLPLC